MKLVQRPGYTLVELMVGLGAASLLMTGLASAMFLAGQTLDHGGARDGPDEQAHDALDDITLDLGHATGFTERTANAVTFKAPARDADGASETIRYSWSGTAGDPLLMAHNGGVPAVLTPNVHSFNLHYSTRSVTGTGFVKGLLDDPSLVAWWKLDETSGTTANDATTNALHGTLYNGPIWTSGQVGGCLHFDGSNDHVHVPHNPVLSITNELTITVWVWINNTRNSGWRVISVKGSDSTWNYAMQTNNRKFVFGFLRDGTWHEVWSPNTLATRRWYHIAAMLEPDGTRRARRLYEDGTEVINARTTRVPLTNSQPLLLGRSTFGEYWSGRLDDVRIYNRKLSADEILQIKNGASE